jgi:hypothetical protein
LQRTSGTSAGQRYAGHPFLFLRASFGGLTDSLSAGHARPRGFKTTLQKGGALREKGSLNEVAFFMLRRITKVKKPAGFFTAGRVGSLGDLLRNILLHYLLMWCW